MHQAPNDNYPEQIRQLRSRLELTQVALAEKLGVSFPTVSRWENGKVKPSQLSWNQLRKLAGELDEEMSAAEDRGELAEVSILHFAAKPEVVVAMAEGERLSFGHMANRVFATEIAYIDPLPHQRIAVYDYMLKQTRLRFLLADDAGAGKTIMSGLYIREMSSRRLLKKDSHRAASGAC